MNAGITSGHTRSCVQDDDSAWRNPRNEYVEVHIDREERSWNSVWMTFNLSGLSEIENHELIGGATAQRCQFNSADLRNAELHGVLLSRVSILGENSWAQLTMNSSASSSRSFSMNGEGSIELKSWFMSRSFSLIECGCAGSVAAVLGDRKRIKKLCYLWYRQSLPGVPSAKCGARFGFEMTIHLRARSLVSRSNCETVTTGSQEYFHIFLNRLLRGNTFRPAPEELFIRYAN